jgi:hypothetical protein
VALLVGEPGNIFLVALTFLAGHLLQAAAGRPSTAHPRALLVGCVAWSLYATWEWLVNTITPAANIRIDLLVIWPILAIVTATALIRAARQIARALRARGRP